MKIKKNKSLIQDKKSKLRDKEKDLLKECAQKEEAIEQEKGRWEQEKVRIAQINHIQDEIVELDISGIFQMKVRRSLLASVPGSTLDAMFSGRHQLKKEDGKVFIDRNPDVFRMMIDFLRNNQRIAPIEDQHVAKQFDLELEYWGLKREEYESQVVKELRRIFEKEPEKVHPTTLALWKELGPFDVGKILERGPIDKSLQIVNKPNSTQYFDYFGQMNL